ncbi:DUF2567 domain-containing protein [Gordonia sp. TBRC 11910]|uniref:DUF2567 domain-containing protein n=1 Tax=Gordonia asplenii TaxID=2725283 RepID=A0A848L9G1_9ACTN|nr:DUF2567 domain-containing protein [Gordonia asplenii]NMO04218.1 DUF2567 domain-containing protein [Gordonia asplenii]
MTSSTPAGGSRRTAGLIVLGGAVVLGAIVGVGWALAAPAPQGQVLADGSAVVPGAQIGRYFDGVGVFSMLMVAVGAVVGFVAWFGARSWRGPEGALLAIGSALAGGAVAMATGTWVFDLRTPAIAGLHAGDVFAVAPNIWLDADTPGAVSAPGLLLVIAPFLTAFVYLCAVLLSRSSDLGRGDLSDESVAAGPAPAQ